MSCSDNNREPKNCLHFSFTASSEVSQTLFLKQWLFLVNLESLASLNTCRPDSQKNMRTIDKNFLKNIYRFKMLQIMDSNYLKWTKN